MPPIRKTDTQEEAILTTIRTQRESPEIILESNTCGCYRCGKVMPCDQLEVMPTEPKKMVLCPECLSEEIICDKAVGKPINLDIVWLYHRYYHRVDLWP